MHDSLVRWLVEGALRLCPAEFRREYRDQILADVGEKRMAWSAVADVVRAGMAMRVENVWRTLHGACRALSNARLSSLVSITAIAVAVATNLVGAALVENVLLRPLPYPDSRQLLFVQETNAGRSLSYPDAQSLAATIGRYAHVALSASDSRTLLGGGRPVALHGRLVSANYFDVIGVQPRLGRSFRISDVGSMRAIISDELWRTRFAGDPSAVGRTMRLGDRDYTVVGIAPANFSDPTPYGLEKPAYWLPIDRSAQATAPSNFNYNAVVRVRSGFDSNLAARDIAAALSALVRNHPGPDFHVAVSSVEERIVGSLKPLLWWLYAIVSSVLLIACANVANLQLARAASREDDLAIRSALGASRRRIAVELSAETALLATVGSLAGLALAWLALRALAPLGSLLLPGWSSMTLDARLFLYAIALVPLTTLLAGTLPMLAHPRRIVAALSAAHSSEHRSPRRLRAALVVVEISLATVLVTCAALVLQSLLRFTGVDLGFEPRNLYDVILPSAPRSSLPSDAERLAFITNASARIRTIPGVVDAAPAVQLPFDCCSATEFTVPGRIERSTPVLYNAIDSEYFRTLRMPLIRGRTFDSRDDETSACAAVVNREFERRYFGTVTAIGKTLVVDLRQNLRCRIVGVVGNVRTTFERPIEPMLFIPLRVDPEFGRIAVRTTGHVPSLAAQIDDAIAAADPTIPPPPVVSYEQLFFRDTLLPRTIVLFLGTFAGIALVLALSGIYAVTAYSAERRTYEFGIRRALGAHRGTIIGNVLTAALVQSGLGIALGLLLTASLARLLGILLYRISPLDPGTFVTVVAVFVLCTIAAALAPALRTTRIDPATALRTAP